MFALDKQWWTQCWNATAKDEDKCVEFMAMCREKLPACASGCGAFGWPFAFYSPKKSKQQGGEEMLRLYIPSCIPGGFHIPKEKGADKANCERVYIIPSDQMKDIREKVKQLLGNLKEHQIPSNN